MLVRPPLLLRLLMRGSLWRKDKKKKRIYLTFDDGPEPEVTPLLLDLLDKYKVKATFFCVGENVLRNPKLYSDILQRGHKTGNHSFNHLKGINYSFEDYIENVEKAAELIDSKLFRPPYGRITQKQRKSLASRYEIVMYDILTHDYDKNISADTIVKKIKQHSRKGSIIIFHDSKKAKENMLASLPRALEFWQKQGYEIATL